MEKAKSCIDDNPENPTKDPAKCGMRGKMVEYNNDGSQGCSLCQSIVFGKTASSDPMTGEHAAQLAIHGNAISDLEKRVSTIESALSSGK